MAGMFLDLQFCIWFVDELPASLNTCGWIWTRERVLSHRILAIDVFLIYCSWSGVKRVSGSRPRS